MVINETYAIPWKLLAAPSVFFVWKGFFNVRNKARVPVTMGTHNLHFLGVISHIYFCSLHLKVVVGLFLDFRCGIRSTSHDFNVHVIFVFILSLDLLKPRSACPWPPGDLLICFMFRDPPHKVLGPRAAHPGFLPSIFWHCCTFSAHKLFTSNYKFAFAGSSSYSSMNNMLTKP